MQELFALIAIFCQIMTGGLALHYRDKYLKTQEPTVTYEMVTEAENLMHEDNVDEWANDYAYGMEHFGFTHNQAIQYANGDAIDLVWSDDSDLADTWTD